MVDRSVTDRVLVDVAADGRVSVSTWLDGELPGPVGEPVDLVWPLDADALEDLRWYLEDYLRAPFGVYEDRGPRVEAMLRGWGEAIFGAVFGAAGPARDALVRLRARGTATEIVFRSASAECLALPWELLRDPARPTPLALDRVAVNRSLPTAALADTFTVGGSRLRVLMVISRPGGAADVGYRMIARPLLERLEAVRGNVELVVLRPPTLARLEEVLAAARTAGEPFQVVHFDGHGVFAGRPDSTGWEPLTFHGPGPEGVLVFEKPGGGADRVPAAEVAAVLAAAQVPVVVLNACQSGAVGKQLEAAVATRLLQEGAASVVAMAYSVYAVAAAEFMAAFYERLFAGDRVADAVAAGRRRLAQRNARPSPKGQLPLADWVVPVHYARRDVRFPGLRTERAAELSLDEMLDRLRESGPAGGGDDPLAPVGGFVGRDGLFYTVEVAARLQKVVVLHGPGGTGKTELAKAFGRWWRDTGGVERPEWVIWHSFEPGVASFGVDGVVAGIGLRVFGTDFARLEAAERRQVVADLLAQRRLLLIWDNFESVHAMPDPTGATPPLADAERAELRAFLARVAAGAASAVLITSRTPETWLGDVRRVEVGGLTPDEAIEYAEELLAPYPHTAARRGQRVFAELMEWLDGHPLSMRLVLPHLDTADPRTLLAGLRGTAPLPGGNDDGADRSTSLPASVAYSFNHLDPAAQRALVAMSLFHGVVDADVLGMFSQVPGVPDRFRAHTAAQWAGMLDRAAGVGLLSPLGSGMYRLHPALPAYLASRWRAEEPDAYHSQRAAGDRALLEACAAFGLWLHQQISAGDAQLAFTLIAAQRPTLGALLGNALDNGLWEQAQVIAQPLEVYWEVRGLHEEARGWGDRARLALETPDGAPPPLDTPGGALWLFLVGRQARREIRAHRLDLAERTYQQIHQTLERQPESPQQRGRLAVLYHQLGRVAQERGRLDQAEDWYHKSLAINEELGNRSDMASSYYQLGRVAQDRE
ncbi:MAG TPA: CHAT domain-containing protein, partial [Pilimelia sp.]|nr:CHAT domain-containing protein [Pilimelia sp.]